MGKGAHYPCVVPVKGSSKEFYKFCKGPLFFHNRVGL